MLKLGQILWALTDPRVALLMEARALLVKRHADGGWPDHSAHVAWWRLAVLQAVLAQH